MMKVVNVTTKDRERIFNKSLMYNISYYHWTRDFENLAANKHEIRNTILEEINNVNSKT